MTNASQVTNNQFKQTKNPKGVSLFHLGTPPTTFQMITKQWASCKALAVSREESTHPEAVPSQPPQLLPCSARTDLPTSETSSNPQQFRGAGCEGQDLAKESHAVWVQTFPVEHRMLRRAARQQLHLSSCHLNTSWLAKTVRKTRSFKLQLCQKSQIGKGHSILHSYFQSTSEVKR